MRWPTIEAISALAPPPAGYRYAPLRHADIAPVIAFLNAHHPGIASGVNSCYLREDFYLRRVCLDRDLDRDVIVVQVLHGEDLVGLWSYEKEVDSLACWGRLLVVAPEHRGKGVTAPAVPGAEAIGRMMGAAFLYGFAPLSTPRMQQALERAGYRLLGFFPGRDREQVAPGVVKRAYQAVYAKLLVPEDQVHWPDPQRMTPRTRDMFRVLFPERQP